MKLKKILFKKDKYLYVDWDYLKDSYNLGYLKGADVFARLFDIVEDDLFASRQKDEYDLKFYDIYIEDWLLFSSFVRNGYITNTYDTDKNLIDLNYCYDICIKFGGVPEFEKYYNTFFGSGSSTSEVSDNNTYNPMTPIEDTKGLYSWRVITSFTSLKTNESVTVCVSSEPVTIFYCRKPITNVQEQENSN